MRLKHIREDKRLTQFDLADKSGIKRPTISSWELGYVEEPKLSDIEALAHGLEVTTEYLQSYLLKTKPPDFPESNRTPQPKQVPIYPEFPSFHLGKSSLPVEYYNYAKAKPSQKNIEGYFVHGNCLSPKIEDGDIIIIDREGAIDNGDIVACLMNDELHIARLRKIADELWLENNDGRYRFQECQVAAPVIEVIKRLK